MYAFWLKVQWKLQFSYCTSSAGNTVFSLLCSANKMPRLHCRQYTHKVLYWKILRRNKQWSMYAQQQCNHGNRTGQRKHLLQIPLRDRTAGILAKHRRPSVYTLPPSPLSGHPNDLFEERTYLKWGLVGTLKNIRRSLSACSPMAYRQIPPLLRHWRCQTTRRYLY